MERVIPAFWKVATIPEALPRWAAGTAFMIAVVFGAAKRPEPMPLRASSSAKTR